MRANRELSYSDSHVRPNVMRLRQITLVLAVLAFASSGNPCAAQIGKATQSPDSNAEEFKLPPFQFGGYKPSAKKEAKKEPAPSGISTVQLIVILTAVSLALVAVGIWSVRLLLATSQTCSWDHYIAKKPTRSPPCYAPKYLEAESFPGCLLYGRLYRIYLFADRIFAIDYGQAGHRKALKYLALLTEAGDEAASTVAIRIPGEVHRIAARIAFLDRLDEAGILELAQFDHRAVVVPRSKIISFGTGGESPWTVFAACSGRLTLQTERRRYVWTFSDRTAQLCAEATLRDESPMKPGTLTTALRLAQPQYEVVDLETAKRPRSARPPF